MLALCALLGLVACSKGGSDRAASTTTLPPPSTAAVPRSDDPFCQFVYSFNERFNRIDMGLVDPARFHAVMQEAANAIREAQVSAPATIRADVTILNTAFQRFVAVLEEANFDVTRLQTSSIAPLQNPEYAAASQRLDAYTRDNCR